MRRLRMDRVGRVIGIAPEVGVGAFLTSGIVGPLLRDDTLWTLGYAAFLAARYIGRCLGFGTLNR